MEKWVVELELSDGNYTKGTFWAANGGAAIEHAIALSYDPFATVYDVYEVTP